MRAELNAALERASRKVDELDFSLQKRKMVEVMGWSEDAVEVMEGEYRKFLQLTAALEDIDSEVVLVPNRPIDEFWHTHIMDTEKYHADCQSVLGHYLHHFPYLGFRDEADVREWQQVSAEGNAVWGEAFGEPLYGDEPNGDAYALDRKWIAELSSAIVAAKLNTAMKCVRKNCKPQKCK